MTVILETVVLRVADIMTREVLVVPASAPLEAVVSALVVRDLAAAPVRDPDGRIVGIVSRAALLDEDRIAAARAANDDPGAPLSTGAVMTPAFVAVHPNDPAIAAVRLLVEEPGHRLLVLDQQGGLAGIVTPADVLRALAPPSRPGPQPLPASAPPTAPEEPRTIH